MTTFGERMRFARMVSGLSIKQASKLNNVTASCLEEIENDLIPSESISLNIFATCYAVGVCWLKDGTENPRTEEYAKKVNAKPICTNDKALLIALYAALPTDEEALQMYGPQARNVLIVSEKREIDKSGSGGS